MSETRKVRIYPCFGDASISTVRKLLGINNEKELGIEFIVTEKNCDYILASELIYYQSEFSKRFKRIVDANPHAIRIFRTGECVSPDFNIFDYAIVFDRDLVNGDRVCRIPFTRYFKESLLVKQSEIDYSKKIKSNLKFCNFIYSNPEAHPYRDMLFRKICEYKRVDSLGKHLNNTGVPSSRFDTNWRQISINLRGPYKFSIASENATFRGYVSEKLISCLQAGTIAIYWGDPSVGEDFNTKSFINCHEYSSLDDVLDRIKEIDQNDDLWLKIATTPWQTDEQRRRMSIDDENYIKFLLNIFSEKNTIRRIGQGTFPEYYSNWFFSRNTLNKKDPLRYCNKMLSKLQNKLK